MYICIQYRLHRVFLFSFPVIGFLTLSPQLLPFIIQSLSQVARLEGEILGTESVRAPNCSTERWLVVAKFFVKRCTLLHFGKKYAVLCCAVLLF